MGTDDPSGDMNVFRFGGYELRLSSRELLADGVPVDVQPKVFDLLHYLVKNKERYVTKDELQDKVWPGVIITETALTRAVMKARRAVGDDADQQRVIKTVHGHGYRFIAELDEQTKTVSPVAVTAAKENFLNPMLLLGIIVVLAATLFAVWWPAGSIAGSGKLAVLPVINATGNDENDWVSYGVMSFVSRVLKDKSNDELASESAVIRKLGEDLAERLQGGLDDALISKVKQQLEAEALVVIRLEALSDQFSFSYGFVDNDNNFEPDSIVGKNIMEMAGRIADDLLGQLSGKKEHTEKFRTVSEDPFVNELFARGMDLQLKGEAAAAAKLFGVAVEQEPTLFWPQYEYALSLRDTGDFDEALERLEKLEQSEDAREPTHRRASVLNGLGIVWWQKGELEKAETYYLEAAEVALQIDKPQTRAIILTNLGIIARRLKKFDEARNYLGQAVSSYEQAGVTPIPASLYNTFANLEWGTGNKHKVEEYFNKALESLQQDPNKRFEAAVINNLGGLKFGQGDWSDARPLLEQGLAIRVEIEDLRGQVLSLHGLSSLNIAEGRLQKAIEQLLEIIKLSGPPGLWREELAARRQLVGMYWETGQIEQAQTAAEVTIKLATKHEQQFPQLEMHGMALKYSKELEDGTRLAGLVALEEELEGLPENSLLMTTRLGIASVMRTLGQTEPALGLLQSIAAWAQENGEAEFARDASLELIKILMDNDEINEAASLLGGLTADWPEHSGITIERARLAELQNDFPLALSWLEKGKQLANERWTEEDEASLQNYRHH